MNSSEQEQIARLKKSNERLTILCIILSVIAIAAGLFGRIQQTLAKEQRYIAERNAQRAAEEKERADEVTKEAIRQRNIAEELAADLAKLRKENTKNTK